LNNELTEVIVVQKWRQYPGSRDTTLADMVALQKAATRWWWYMAALKW
jgi:hypothetical protein